MNDLSQNGYTNEEVINMLRQNRTIDLSFELLDNQEKVITKLNKATGSISFNSESEIMGTASFEVLKRDIETFDILDMRIRPIFRLLSPSGWLEYQLGVYIITTPRESRKDHVNLLSVDCYDKGIILQEDRLLDRLYIAAGSNYVQEIKKVIMSSGIDKMNIEASPLSLKADLEFEIGTNKLEIVNNLLYAINYNPLHFDVLGNAVSNRYIEPSGRETEFGYMTDNKSIIKEGGSRTNDLYNVPNVIVRYTDNPDIGVLRSEYINDKDDSIVSTVRRGRRIVDVESVDDIADQDTLDAYVRRVAIEKNQIYDVVNLPTALMPHHSYRDCIYVRNDDLGIENKYIEYSWSMALEIGGTMNHELKRVTLL